MRTNVNTLVLLTLVGAGSACAHTPNNSPSTIQDNLAAAPIALGAEQTRVTGEYLVTLAAGANDKVISNSYERFGIKSIKDLGASTFQLNLSEDPGPEKMEELRRQDPRIKSVQPNFIYRANPAGGAQ